MIDDSHGRVHSSPAGDYIWGRARRPKGAAARRGGKMTASTRTLAVHPAQVAGTFYPADPAALGAALDAAFAAAPPGPFRAKMVVVPHAGIAFSGVIAA